MPLAASLQLLPRCSLLSSAIGSSATLPNALPATVLRCADWCLFAMRRRVRKHVPAPCGVTMTTRYHKALGLRAEDSFCAQMLKKALEEMSELPAILDEHPV